MRVRVFGAGCLLACAAAVVAAAGAPQTRFAKGSVVEGVACEADASQTFALYLPTSYTPERTWPILYVFDPAGRGPLAVELFRAAAERYGYVVVGSNNSRNGLRPEVLARVVGTLWKDTRARLSIDDRRIYAAGFSGGARVANRLASSCGGCVAGVISCGAGFPSDIKPAAPLPYVFYGLVGIDDYNFRDLRTLGRALGAAGAAHRFETFEGRHQWPPSERIVEAVEWLEVQAAREGRRAKDEALVGGAWAKLLARLERLKGETEAAERHRVLRLLAEGFEGLRETGRFASEASAVAKSKGFAAALAEEDRQFARQQELAAELKSIGGRLLEETTRAGALAKLRSALGELRRKAEGGQDTPERRVARRALAHVYAETLEAAVFLYAPRKEYRLAAVNLELAAEVFPRLAHTEYELARVLALEGRVSDALAALGRALDKGFRDAAALEGEEAFKPLRAEAEYKRLLERVKSAAEKGTG
jgi:hypothetical protein